MSLPLGVFDPPRVLARYTPDSRRWRRRVAGLAAVGGPLALYAAYAVASGVKSGMLYNLLILLFGILALVLPAVAVAVLLSPNSGLNRSDPSPSGDAVETLKKRYATGEINHEEFDRRLDDLIGASEDTLNRRKGNPSSEQPKRDEEREQAGK